MATKRSVLVVVVALLALLGALFSRQSQVGYAVPEGLNASEGSGCGYAELYGPYGVIAREQSPDLLLALTVCQPNAFFNSVDEAPRIDWGDGNGWQTDGVTASDCSGVFLCKFYGHHTYASPGLYSVHLRYYQTSLSYYTSPVIVVYATVKPPPAGISHESWMTQMRDQIGPIPLNLLAIPRTHDSGAYGFSSSSVVAPDFPTMIADQLQGAADNANAATANCPTVLDSICRLLLQSFADKVSSIATTGFEPGGSVGNVADPIGRFIADTANAQGVDIGQQLLDGIRAFDFRLCVPVGSVTEVTACHGLYNSTSFSAMLQQIKQFVLSHPQEIVIIGLDRFIDAQGLDQSNTSSATVPMHQAVVTEIRQLFSTDPGGDCSQPAFCLLVSPSLGTTATLNSIWATLGRVILLDSNKGGVTDWEKTQYPSNPILWDGSDAAWGGGEWIGQNGDVNDQGTYWNDTLDDLGCRCWHYSQEFSSPANSEMFGLSANISPTDDWVTSALVQRVMGGNSGAIAAKAVMGGNYIAMGYDVANGQVLREMAKITNAFVLNRIYDLYVLKPFLRKNINELTVDWENESSLVDIAIALNHITVPHFIASATAGADGKASYEAGSWTRYPVHVLFRCISPDVTQEGSGIQTVSDETAGTSVTIAPSLCQGLGMTAPPLSFGPIRIDKTAPVITPAAVNNDGSSYHAGDWTNQDVTVSFACADAGGVQSGIDQSASSTSPPQRFRSETISVTATSTGVCQDLAGNVASTASFSPIMIDKTAPDIEPVATTADGKPYQFDTWTNQSVTVQFTCTETGAVQSGIASNTLTGATVATEGAGQQASSGGSCSDRAGNVAPAITVAPIKIDKTKPVLTATAKTKDGKDYHAGDWTNQEVTVTFTCADTGPVQSGVATDAGFMKTLTAETPGVTVNSADIDVCKDQAGNQADALSFGPVKIDKTPPSCSAAASPNSIWPPNHKAVPVSVTVTVSDSLSGPAGFVLQAAVASGQASDMSGFVVGQASTSGQMAAIKDELYTLTYLASDKAGNTSSCSVTVAVPNDQGTH
jgi:hypothetical protein